MSDDTRFWAKVEKRPDGCWVWIGGSGPNGYGKFGLARPHKHKVLAHRWSWTSLRGPIPEGLQIDHLCRNRACVNPAHLEPVTRLENVRRGHGGRHNAVKTHCPAGHPYDEENTLLQASGRACRICCRTASREYQRRKRAARVAAA